jgi:hypothetical protein
LHDTLLPIGAQLTRADRDPSIVHYATEPENLTAPRGYTPGMPTMQRIPADSAVEQGLCDDRKH